MYMYLSPSLRLLLIQHHLHPQGHGTAFEGLVCMPREGGVRKGWDQVWLAVCDGYLSIHDRPDMTKKKDKKDLNVSTTGDAITAESSIVIDLRWAVL